ncbi:hypothetical protein ACWDWO_08990 [Actinopolymorpha singaporensis]
MRTIGPRAALVGWGATIALARHDHASLDLQRSGPRPLPVHRWESTYGVPVRHSNSTGRNGDPAGASGNVG